jgi:heme exporter protein B
MTAFMGNALAIMRKDIVLELRGKESLSLMFFLSLLFLVIFNLSLDLDSEKTASLASGILWVIFSFTGILGMGRTSMAERDEDAYLSIVFSPASSESLYLGKVISNLILLLLIELSTLFFFAILFDFEKTVLLLPSLLPSLVLGTIGFSVIGTLFSFLTTTSKYGEVLLPFLFLPVVSPIILGGVSAMNTILEGRPFAESLKWIQILAVFDFMYLCVSLLLFNYLIEE